MIIKPTTCLAKKLTATGKAVDAGTGVCGVILAAGSGAAATVVLDDSEAGTGTALLKLAAVAGGSAVYSGAPIRFASGCYATLSGTGAEVTVLYY